MRPKQVGWFAGLLVLGCVERSGEQSDARAPIEIAPGAAAGSDGAGAAPADATTNEPPAVVGEPPATAGDGSAGSRATDDDEAGASEPPPSACQDAGCDPEEGSCAIVQGAAVCTCARGYRDIHGDGTACEGIDECAAGQHDCAADAICIDTPSGYACVCEPGFHGDGVMECVRNASCADSQDCGDSAICLSLDDTQSACACSNGYEGNGFQCDQLEECVRGLDDCHPLAACVDGGWLYGCECPDGYLGDGRGASGCLLPSSRVTEPTIPPIGARTCPTFTVGTHTLSEHLGATLVVGEKSAAPDAPLLLYWHGTGSTAGEFLSTLPEAMLREIEDAGGIIASFDTSTGTGGDCSGTRIFSKDDFEVADLIVACAVRDHNIDPRRIYVTGCSAGGLQAGCMAIERSSYIAAVATNSGGLAYRETMQGAHVPAAFMMFSGASGGPVVIDFRQTSDALAAQIELFGGEALGCAHAMGHCGAPDDLYLEAWEFMKTHPFGVGRAPFDAGLPAGLPGYCERY